MSPMSTDLYEEAIVDVVGPETMLSDPFVIKDLQLGTITTKHLNFSSHFTLTSTCERKTKVSALILYFDTFFTTTGKPILPNTQVKVVKEGDVTLAEIWPVGGKAAPQRRASQGRESIGKVTSFSTGPQSIPTHWKQTLFLLKEPIMVDEGGLHSVVTDLGDHDL
jgi:type I protein arginine methyltransferase